MMMPAVVPEIKDYITACYYYAYTFNCHAL